MYFQVFLLNAVVCGLEFCASAAFTYIPPMLLKAGLSEENMSFVLGIGPFMGFLLVPVIGRASDNCRSRYGRRRPFILALSLILILSLLIIPYGQLLGNYIFGMTPINKTFSVVTLIVGAVILDFTSQATLTPCEALLSDACKHTNQSERCFMVYSFMVSLGGIVGYLITALDWSNTPLGKLLGGQERSAFTVLIVLFIFSLVFTLAVAQEQPLVHRRSRDKHLCLSSEDTDSPSTAITEKLDHIHQTLVKEKDLSLVIPNPDLGYDSGSNYSASEDFSPSNGIGIDTQHKTLKHVQSQISVGGPSESGSQRFFWIFPDRTCKIPFTRLSVPLFRLDTFLHFLWVRLYALLPQNLRTLFEMPTVLKRLALANFFSWTAVMGFNLFYTDFVGQFIYGGNPNAEEDSPLRSLYDEGVRMASWGLLFHCVTSAIYAAFIERITARYGYLLTYLIGMTTFTFVMALMVFSHGIWLTNILAACTGIGYTTLTTIPFMLVAEYHQCKEVSLTYTVST